MNAPESANDPGGRSPTRVQSVQRAVRALLYVVDKPDGATGTEIAQALDLPTPTVFHLINTLVDEGMLAKFERRYHLGPRLGVIADAFTRTHSPPPHLRGPLLRLAEQTNETAYLTGWRHGEVVVIESVEGQYPLKAAAPHTGFYGHAHSRASGKCLLAALDDDALDSYFADHELDALTANTITDEDEVRQALRRVREQGFAIEVEEFSVGIACLAMPLTQDHATFGAYSITAPAQRLVERKDEYLERLREATAEATQATPAGAAR